MRHFRDFYPLDAKKGAEGRLSRRFLLPCSLERFVTYGEHHACERSRAFRFTCGRLCKDALTENTGHDYGLAIKKPGRFVGKQNCFFADFDERTEFEAE